MARKVFISFFGGDRSRVDDFIHTYAERAGVFIPRVLGANFNDEFVDSTNPEYVMSRIRSEYIYDSTVTIVLIGECTHSRRYVDWELKASLTQAQDGAPNGVMAILLPHLRSGHLPDRFKANYQTDDGGYARFYRYPSTPGELNSWIEDAYRARTERVQLVKNERVSMGYNAQCLTHGITHPAG